MSSPLHFPGMTYLQGPYTINYTDISHDGDTKTLWTPTVGDNLLAVYGDMATSIAGKAGGNPFSSAGLNFGTVASPTLFSAEGVYDFTQFTYIATTHFPYIVLLSSPIIITYSASGEGNLTAGHVEMYAVISRSPVS